MFLKLNSALKYSKLAGIPEKDVIEACFQGQLDRLGLNYTVKVKLKVDSK